MEVWGLWHRPIAGARKAEALDTQPEYTADRGAQLWRFRAREGPLRASSPHPVPQRPIPQMEKRRPREGGTYPEL